MEVASLRMYAMLISNEGIENQEKKLEEQMKGLNPMSPEYAYDQLVLKREERELQIRKAHPEIDPQTRAGDTDLQKLMGQDPILRSIHSSLQEM